MVAYIASTGVIHADGKAHHAAGTDIIYRVRLQPGMEEVIDDRQLAAQELHQVVSEGVQVIPQLLLGNILPRPTFDPDDAASLIELYYERGWTDGLPVVPPSETSVKKMLDAAGVDAGRHRSDLCRGVPGL